MITVVVVDDHPTIRLGVSAVLDGVTDIRIIGEADSGPKLWELLKEITPDIVLLDISMHGFDVLEAIGRLRQEYPCIRIIIVTFHDEEKYVLRTTNLGVDGYLIKEEPEAEYIKAIRIVARGGTYFSQRIVPIMTGSQSKQKEHRLTAREIEVLDLLATGVSTERIAEELYITTRTASTHLTNIYQKLGVDSRTAAVRKAIELGIVIV
ncbi:MAG: response regulator transcription factor [Anaerolineae bacterium]|nr:response regulator transcription factor [Anaerolineae bacterium]